MYKYGQYYSRYLYISKNNCIIGAIMLSMLMISSILFNLNSPRVDVILEIQLLIFGALATIISIIEFGIMSLTSMFLICFDLFGLGGIIARYLGGNPYTIYNGSFGLFIWTYDTKIRVLFLYYVFLLVFYIFSFCVKNRGGKYKKSVKNLQNVKSLYIIGKYLMVIALPFVLFILFKEISAARSGGYTSIYVETVSIPSYIRIFRLLFVVGFYVICASCTTIKEFKFGAYLCLGYEMLGALKGGRAGLIVTIMFILFFQYHRFGKKPSVKFIVAAGIIGIPILTLITYWRSGEAFSGNIFELYSGFLKETGASIHVAAMYVQEGRIMNDNAYPYILEPLLRLPLIVKYPFLMSEGQTPEVLSVRFNLSHQLSAHMDYVTYLSGGGLGNSCIAELSEFGFGGIILGAIVLAWILKFIEGKLTESLLLRYFSFFIVSHVLLMPRGSFFMDTYNIFKYLLIYIFIYAIWKLTERKVLR